MKFNDIPDGSNLELRFSYQGKEYFANVNLQFKKADKIYIKAIQVNDCYLDKVNLCDTKIIYKSDDGLYIFTKINLKLTSFLGIYMYAVTSGHIAERINRREDIRVGVKEVLPIKMIKKSGVLIKHYGFLKDISLAGMGIVLSHRVEDAAAIEVIVDLNEVGKVTLLGQVVRITELSNNNGYLYGCKFNDLKDILGRYIIKQQITDRSKINKIS